MATFIVTYTLNNQYGPDGELTAVARTIDVPDEDADAVRQGQITPEDGYNVTQILEIIDHTPRKESP